MRVKILKSFPYAAEGIHSKLVQADTHEDIRDDLIEGLEKDGYIDAGGRKPSKGGDEQALREQLRQVEDLNGDLQKRVTELEGELSTANKRIAELETALVEAQKAGGADAGAKDPAPAGDDEGSKAKKAEKPKA